MGNHHQDAPFTPSKRGRDRNRADYPHHHLLHRFPPVLTFRSTFLSIFFSWIPREPCDRCVSEIRPAGGSSRVVKSATSRAMAATGADEISRSNICANAALS